MASKTNDKTQIETLCVNTIKTLSIDAIQKANSGHPGMPMGAAKLGFALWDKHLKFDPAHPDWPGRDRFVLSAGHGSMLLYALLYLFGYDITLDDIRDFRQWDSNTPGHPELGVTPGVETTTGPLGQGVANAVGMALAERFLAAKYNKPKFPIIDNYTYFLCGDGDLMEGVSYEAASVAGHLKLNKLIGIYDDNRITIEGGTDLTFSEDVAARFEAVGWDTIACDGEDLESIGKAIEKGKQSDKPTLIIAKTHIASGSPGKQDSESSHGAPLGEEEVEATKKNIEWYWDEPFFVPDAVLDYCRASTARGEAGYEKWTKLFEEYKAAHPGDAAELQMALAGELPAGWDAALPMFDVGDNIATRGASGKALNAIAPGIPTLLGGSADLGPSNKTVLDGEDSQSAENPAGRNIHYGVREHAMGAISNGMALYGGVIPYTGTFLVFADYIRPAIRMAALMRLRVIFVFSHDSIGVGEDGPTHQPIEQTASLRLIPGLRVIRPADANETAEAWRLALEYDGPTAIVTSRQKLPVLDRSDAPSASAIRKGGYVLLNAAGKAGLILLASGSEVRLAVEAARRLAEDGITANVVNIACWKLFDEQSQEYRDEVLPPKTKARLAIEAGATMGWYKYVGDGGEVMGIDRFGASAPGPVVFEKYGFTTDNVVKRAKALVGKK
ncbi:MAG: transketolase [bacterium]|nr:transketolase [bacterium]